MNANLFHNLLNFASLIIGSLVTYDWTTLGVNPATAAQIAGGVLAANSVIKLGVNISRDGLTGLVAPQPPVQK
jgi:hypothetical protein